ncbi:FG-GAP repeat protein [Prosthecobacter fusiformis]|uniref:FG-GAP repeat protein n=1 Tax=Prosthecobacter fusiformis TaxID=48464 RepID=A0A4R7RMH1_9BACT|nr:choice-of-anchor D domain-containing protein [Prosthecobacter fusiformis]TDU66522.1 FG-GAP repeat protein [Prosthecobacter fusiformis]
MMIRLPVSHVICGLMVTLLFAATQIQAEPAQVAEQTPVATGKPQQMTSPDQVPEGLGKSDWQNIRAAHKAWEHSFLPMEDGWQARNGGQQWITQFDGRGFLARPKGADWQWGLELRSYGFGRQQRAVAGRPAVKAEGQRLSYQWDADVQEWFVNDERGLEHGFTMARRPEGAAAGAELDVVLGTRGTLKASVAADAQTIYFRDAAGAPVVTYAGLKVWDADGQVLASHFLAGPAGGIILRVQEGAARYPITIDPIAQQAYVKPSLESLGYAGVGDCFGWSVAVSGDTVVVGAREEDSSTPGVNGTPNENASNSGAAYVFVRSGSTWSQQAYLKAAQVTMNDQFGDSVAVSGDTVVVGAYLEDGSTPGINGMPDELVGNSGAAYVFVRSGTEWSQQAYLKAAQVTGGDYFGASVAVSGDTVVVGATQEDSSTPGVNGTPDESASASGAAYVFVRSGTEWSQQAYLKAAQVTGDDYFGFSVAVSGDTVVVGAYQEDGSTPGVNGTPNEGASASGAAYVFVRSGSTWSQQAYLKAAQVSASDQFGFSVAVSGDTVVVGAREEDSSTPGVNGTPDESASASGAAYVFVRSGTEWSQQAYLKAAQVTASDYFGFSVAVSGDTVVVGAYQEDGGTPGINGTPNELASGSGAAYIFTGLGPVAPVPAVTGVDIASGSTAGGTTVTITGTGFTGATDVTFGGVAAVIFTVVNDTTITATAPAHEAGPVSLQVTTSGGQSVANSLYTYVVPAPTVALNTGGLIRTATTLTITGTNFDAATPGNNTVVFSPAGSGTVTASTATSLTVTSLSGLRPGALNAVVTTHGLSSHPAVQVATVSNSAPTGLALSHTTLHENSAANSTVGTLNSTDPDGPETFIYTLVTGTGSTDNEAFNISGDALRISAVPDYETKSSYSVRVSTTDSGGLTFEHSFTITITNSNESPTALALSADTLPENSAPNSTVGTLSSTDPDAGDTFTYTLVSGTGGTDNAAFNISGSALRFTDVPDYETQSSYSVRVSTIDSGGLIFENSFTITITDVNDAPTALALSGSTVSENNLANATVGTLSATDPDPDSTHTFSLVEGTGDTDNDSFSIVDTQLRISVSADYETKSTYSIRVQADDGEGGLHEQVFTLTILDVAEPVIAILGKDQPITNGDTTPDAADATDFGRVALINTPVTHLFTIANGGDATLNLASPAVVLSGPGAADFKVTTPPAAAVAASDQTTFAITFDPLLPGLRTATVTVASDDGANGIYSFTITGFGGLTKPLAQTITFTPPTTVYLGQSPLNLSAYASSGLPVTLSVVPVGTTAAGASFAGNVLGFTGIGKVKVQAVQAGDGSYAAAKTVVKTITVKATPATLTLVDLAQTYTGTPRAIGTLGGSGEVMIEYKIGTVFGSTAPTAAGKYSVKATDSSGTKTGSLTINKAPLYVTPDDKRKFAGQENPELTVVYSGFRESDTVAVFTKTPVLKTTAKATSGGGLYLITASGGVASNYLFVYQQGTMVVESFGGSYEALLVDADALPVGKLTLTVPLTGQAFTGKLATATETAALSLKGSLTTNVGDELATGTCTVMKGSVPYVVSFTLPMQGDMLVTASRAAQPLGGAVTGRKLLLLPKGGKVLYGGAHTVVLEPALPAAGDIPAGAGWAKSTLSTTGVMTLAGRLADGTVFTTSLAPDEDPDPGYRLFVQPYKSRRESSLGGVFTLLPHPTLANRRYVEEAGLIWEKEGLAADATYRVGFGPVTTVMMLDPWLLPVAAKGSTPAITLAARLGLTDGSFGVWHSDTGSTLNGNLPTRVGLSLKNVVSVQLPETTPVNPTKWKTTLVPTTGLFSGSFELADTGAKPRVVTFIGVLRQPATAPDILIGDGHYLLPALPSAPSPEKVSGEVRFTRP